MQGQEYAVIDVETTSGDPLAGKITEVAVIITNGQRELERWSSIVNPGEPIPKFIQMLTGITNGMVKNAPCLDECSEKLFEMLYGRTIVAHNYRFDMTVLEEEFKRMGKNFTAQVLCTENLSRMLLPDCDHYNLVSLCHYLEIPFKGHHRAMNDAQATMNILHALLRDNDQRTILASLIDWPITASTQKQKRA